MIQCPTCLQAVADDSDHCPLCSSDLPGGTDVEHINEEIPWEIIRTVSTEIEARLIAGRLRSEGIPAFVMSQVDSTRNLTVGALAVAKVYVPFALVDEAEAILATDVELSEDEDISSL